MRASFSIICCNCSYMRWQYKLIACLHKVHPDYSSYRMTTSMNISHGKLCARSLHLKGTHQIGTINIGNKEAEREKNGRLCVKKWNASCTHWFSIALNEHMAWGVMRSLLLENLHRNFLSKTHKIQIIFKVVSVSKWKSWWTWNNFSSLSFCCLYENGKACSNEWNENSLWEWVCERESNC